MKKLALFIGFAFVLCGLGSAVQAQDLYAQDFSGKKILFVEAYHEGYEWSDGLTDGVRRVLDKTNVEWRIHRMDTKRNDNVEFFKPAGLDAKKAIEEYKPDVVIASDDNASRYTMVPYFKDAALPFV